VDAQGALMIGDRRHDAIGAQNNGMDFIGALYGYGDIDEYRASGFSRWVSSPADLLALI
jgi:phosphoglycolate phosphatase